ncbi:hypothetical protein GCM10010518_18140 [Kitasatospora cinereorecta]
MSRTICPTNIMGGCARRRQHSAPVRRNFSGTDANDFALYRDNPITGPSSAGARVTARWRG